MAAGVLALGASAAFAQIAAWQFGSPASAGNEVTYAATTLDANLFAGTELSRGSGIVATGLLRAFSANNWDASATQGDAITNNEYYQFSVEAASGYQVSLSTIDAKIRRTSAGPNAYLWRYSLDGTIFTDIGTPTNYTGTQSDGLVQTQIDISGISALQAVQSGTTVTLRLYAWGATDLTGTFAFGRYANGITTNSLAIGGTVSPGSGPTNTSVEFASTSGSVAENAGSTTLTLSITAPDPVNATSVDVVLVSGDAARINNYTTQTVTFPGGSSADQTVTITVTDNINCDNDEVLTLELQNITGGQGTPVIGGNDTFVLTVTNDDTPADPVAAAATGLLADGFTANWNAVNGATGYFLDVSSSPTFGTFVPVTVDEGFSGGRDALPTGWSHTGLGTDYTSAGNFGMATPSLKFDDSNDQLLSDTYPGPATSVSFWYKGQATANTASSMLTEGWNGSSWVAIGTLTNIATNAVGTETYALNEFDGFVQFRFTYTKASGNLAFDDFSVTYTSGTPDYVPGYENLAVAGTSQAVTGLDPLTSYYYRVRSTGGCSTGNNSNVENATTLAGVNPALSSTSLADFGGVCLNTGSTPQSFTVNGANLTVADVTVGPLAGFSFSTTEAGTYTASLSFSQPGGTFSQEVWVIFSPAAEQSYDGDIPISGGGAPAVDASVTGNGINTMATASTGGSSNVTNSQAELAGTIDDEGCSGVMDYGIEYSTTQGFAPGTGTQVASSNLSGADFSSVLTGLLPCTVYYYVAYATNNGGTAYGTENSFETSPIGATTATLPGTVNTNDFTATWDAFQGATGYRLDVSTSPTFGTIGAMNLQEGFSGGRSSLPAGWSHTGLGTDYTTGGNFGLASPSLKFDDSNDQLTSTLLSGPATSLSFWYKGQGTNGSASTLLVEGWNGSTWSTLGSLTGIASNHVDTWSTSLNQGDGYVQFRFTYTKVSGNLAFDDVAIDYTGITPSFLPGYENLAVAGTSQAVTGLNNSTTYYYRVRVEGGSCVSGNSNTIAVTTLACPGNSFVVVINTDANGDQISWEVVDETNTTVAAGGPYPGQNNQQIIETVCLGNAPMPACYGLRLYDDAGDGLSGAGNWQVRTTNGRVLIADDFISGYVSPSATPQTPSYGSGHSFCLPEGPSRIMANECNVFTNGMYDKVYCSKVTGATQYQFEFSNPDAGYMRRIARPHNYVVFYEMVSSPLVPGVVYFTRARTNEQGPLASAHWGSGCDLGLGIAQVVQCTQLIQAPAYGHSCNETRSFTAPYNYLYARPVTGATTYTFKITGDDGNYNSGIEFVRSTYILALGWSTDEAPALTDQTTYQVQVRVTVNGIEGTYCGNTCNVTIDNNPNLGIRVAQTEGQPELNLWPNPNNGQHLNVALGGLNSEITTADVRLMDLTGRMALGTQLSVVDGAINSVIELGNAANGTYLLQVIAGGNTYTQRVVVNK